MTFRKCATSLCIAVAVSIVLFVSLTKTHAATVGSWSKSCLAPNWMTGAMEQVFEANVHAPGSPFWGFASRQAGGRWLIQYNTARIFGPVSTRAVLIFLFYHECAHAQLNNPDERAADCHGLAKMREDMDVTPAMLAEISKAYASVMRAFPTGGPCL